MDNQLMQAIFEALGPVKAPEKQEMLTDARPYLTAPPIARLVGALVDAVNSTKAERKRVKTEHRQLVGYIKHSDFVSRYLYQYRPLLQRVGVEDWVAFGRYVKTHGGWSSVHEHMCNTIRQFRPLIDANDLESERKILSHAITFYCLRVYKAHTILDHMSEQEVWMRMKMNVLELKHTHSDFENTFSQQCLLNIYEKLADGIMFYKTLSLENSIL
jgi:hypothetical protein